MASRAFLSLLADEQDSSLRYSLYLTATLTTTTDRLPVTVCEIGCNGVRVEGSGLPRIGRDVIVSCGPREIFGRIVSADALAREIEFEDAIDEGLPSKLWDMSPTVGPHLCNTSFRERL